MQIPQATVRRGRPPKNKQDTRTQLEKSRARLATRRKRAMLIVEQFDALPDIARVSPPVVEILLNLSSATLWRRVKAKAIEAPAHDGRMPYWTAGYIRTLLRAA